jgi:UDP-N-acetylmuramoylalanine--D-glutamate ligase
MQVAIIGFGVEGQSAVHYWQDQAADITVCDQNTSLVLPANVQGQLGDGYLHNLDRFDVVMRSAGIHPEIILKENPGIASKLTTVINEFVRVCPSKNIIGITGTKGKGTTSTLTTRMLEAAGHKVFLGGNIGISPFTFLGQISPEDWVVLELSSFQLHDFHERIRLAACLMMAGEHFNWHQNFDNYAHAKQNLFAHQEHTDTAIYFADNELSHAIASVSPGKKIPYYASPGAYVEDGKIVIDTQVLCDVKDIKLLGKHNWQNACAAATIVWQVTQAPDAISSVLTSFAGLPHRLEFVREQEGVRYYNDSFASAPPAAVAAAEAITGNKVMILGGFDRNLPLEELAAGLRARSGEIRALLLVGASAERLVDELDATGLTYQVSHARTMEQIVQEARELAKKGDAIVLSPAFPSFDMFKNFEERGDLFKKVVHSL